MAAEKKKTFRCQSDLDPMHDDWLSRKWSQQAASKMFKVDDPAALRTFPCEFF